MAAEAHKRCSHCGTLAAPEALYCPRDGKPLLDSLGELGAPPSGATGPNTRGGSPAASSAEDPAAFDPFVGLKLAGQIRIRELIGVGAMGRVYRAHQGGIDRDVAVKILRPELALNAEAAARFHREARISSRLTHPHVVQVMMSGAIESDAPEIAGTLYLVMEHLDGISLLAAMAAAGAEGDRALPISRALAIVLQVCDAVGDAHRHGIIHRDLKPENVMLIERGGNRDYVKVLDFGIARLVDSGSMWTGAGLIFGSAAYISPEGAMGEQVGPSADVYSIAVILYECLAGRAPFLSDSPVKLLLSHAQESPADLRSLARGSEVPAAIAEVVMQNLAKDPRERAANGNELAKALSDAARRTGIDLDPVSGRSPTRSAPRVAPSVPTRALGGRSIDEAHAKPSSSRGTPTRPIARVERRPDRESAPASSSGERPLDTPAPTTASPPLPPPREPATALGRAAMRGGALWYLAIVATAVVAGMLGHRWRSVEPFDATAAELRNAIRDGNWITPPDHNVRVLLDQLTNRFPNDPRVRELRAEAGERLLADALRLKYAGKITEAVLRARLAMEIAPELEAPAKLLMELRQANGAASASSRKEGQ
jgi:serine/threonine protein kinase